MFLRSTMYQRRWRAFGVLTLMLVASAVFAASASATVPGPNGLIAFRADVGSGDQIYLIHPDGTGQARITNLSGNAEQPHWSPSSQLITFGFEPNNPNRCSNVAWMHADGRHVTILPEANGDICEGNPSFGPTGQRIYYEGFDGSRDAIFSMNLYGKNRHLVSNCQGSGGTDPEVAPNGKMFSMTCFSPDGQQQALFDARIDGSHLRQLTPWHLHVGVKADWSPDSRRIMFISTHDEGAPDAQVNTATIRPDGTGLFWVTRYPAGGTLAYGNTYSPDGRWILMRLEQNGQYALYKIHPNGQGLRAVTPFSTFRPRGMSWGSHPSKEER
jgi:Tol biopolymer transport system component